MSDLNAPQQDVSFFLNNEVSIEEKYKIFSQLPLPEKRKILEASPELKKAFLQLRTTQNQEVRREQIQKYIDQERTTHSASTNEAKKTIQPQQETPEIQKAKKQIQNNAKKFLKLYFSCSEIGLYWTWMLNEIVHSFSGLEMNMKLKNTISQEEQAHIRNIYHQEIKATGSAFIRSLDYSLREPDKLITEDFIKELHRIVLPTEPEHAGAYRRIKVRFPNTQTVLPNYEKVPTLMAKMIADNNKIKDPIEKAFRFHFDLAAIHPFTDGNGRTSRFVMNTILMQNDLPPIIIDPKEKRSYIKAMETYSLKGNDVPYRLFMLNQLRKSLNRSIARLEFLPHTMEETEKKQPSKYARSQILNQVILNQRKER